MSQTAPARTPSRRERERNSRRREMLEAARAVIADKGYARATLDEIAARAEFGKGTLYNYFPGGKDEILFAVFDQLYDDLVMIAQTTLDGALPEDAGSVRAQFGEFIAGCINYYERQEELFLILTKEAYRMSFSDRSERVEYFLSQRERLISAITPAVTAGVDSGFITKADPRSIAQMILGNIHGYQMHRCLLARNNTDDLTEREPSPSEAGHFVTAMLFDGLLVRPAETPTP